MRAAGTRNWRRLFALLCAGALLIAGCDELQNGPDSDPGVGQVAPGGIGTEPAPEPIPAASGEGFTYTPGQVQARGLPLREGAASVQEIFQYDGIAQQLHSVSNGQYLPVWPMHEGAEGYHPREVSIVDFASGEVVAHYQAPPEF